MDAFRLGEVVGYAMTSLAFNIVAVPQIFTFPPQPLPLEKGGAWSLCSILGDIWVNNRVTDAKPRAIKLV